MNITETYLVPENIAPARLQEYGVGIFQAFPTKSALKKALKKGYIKVDGSIATTATFIRGGETITLEVPEAEEKKGKQLIFPLQVFFEDEHLAVIHKPAGILVSGNSFKTIARALPQNLQPSNLSDAAVPQPVHRLDYATTGLLLAGKTSSSIRRLNKMFEDKQVQKTYAAVTIGDMEPRGKISTTVDGKPSESDYVVQARVPSERFGQLNLVQLTPHTGRRHQLRKHLAGIGNPILGDREYGKEGLILKGKGLYLHALKLEFTHPFTKEVLRLEDPLPGRFLKVMRPKPKKTT